MTPAEINEAVARKLGWKYHEDLKPVCWQTPSGGAYLADLPDYSTSIEAAWEVVEAMLKDRIVVLTMTGTIGYSCQWGGSESVADTAPLAICQAFLKLL